MKRNQSLRAPILIFSLGLFLISLSGCGAEPEAKAKVVPPEATTHADDTTHSDHTDDQTTDPGTDTNPGNNGDTSGGDNGVPGNNGNNGDNGNGGNDNGNNGGTDTTPGGNDNNNDNSGGTDTNPDLGDCSRVGFQALQEIAETDGTNYSYRAAQGPEALFDLLAVDSYGEWSGPTAPGTYVLDGINYKDCGLCLRLSAGCNGENCDKMFYANEGAVEISSIGSDGTPFVASMNGVVFKESTFEEDFTSVEVPGGETWCLDGYSFNQEFGAGVTTNDPGTGNGDTGTTTPGTGNGDSNPDNGGTPPPSAGSCVENGTGNNLNAQIGNFTLQNCAGEWINLHDDCGQKKAVWLIQSTTWCPACPSTVVPAAENDTAIPDLRTWVKMVLMHPLA